MPRLSHFFRPLLEWLEARLAPAVGVDPGPALVHQAIVYAPPPQSPALVDHDAVDQVFSSGGLLPYLDDALIAPGEVVEPPAPPSAALVDAVFSLGTVPAIPAPPTFVTDTVFASGFTRGHAMFDFIPPPPPRGLPPTPAGAGDTIVQPLEVAALTSPIDIEEMPGTADPDTADPDEAEIVIAA